MNLWFQGRGLNTAQVVNISIFLMILAHTYMTDKNLQKTQVHTKQFVRKQISSLRNDLTPDEVRLNSKIICQRIADLYPSIMCKATALYLPFGNEVDLTSLLLAGDNSFHIPSVQNKNMQFQKWSTELRINRHTLGMQQPQFQPDLPPTQLSICLMPLLGFDDQGHRLGMGGGFYDRYFENNKDTLLIGVAHDCQQWPQLPHDGWDVKLHAIITESQHISFNSDINQT